MSTYDEMYPDSTPIEDKIKLLLTMRGYKSSDIHFRTTGGTNQRHLRNGYWKPVEYNDLQYIMTIEKDLTLEEFSIYDDDCGWKYGYDIHNK
jgi:hypothetical protein